MQSYSLNDARLPARFWRRIAVDGLTGCWCWTGPLLKGYGRWTDGARETRVEQAAHRVAYKALIGPIPDGMDLDHLCRNRACCHPAHVEPVTRAVNVQRGLVPSLVRDLHQKKRQRPACNRGHPYTESTTRQTREGWRVCLTCEQERRQHG